MIYPQNFETKIGFDEIRALLQQQCLSSLGKERVGQMTFLTDVKQIREKQEHTREFLRIMEEEDLFPDQYFFDVRDSVKRIRIEGTYLDEQELFDLKRSLETIAGLSCPSAHSPARRYGAPLASYASGQPPAHFWRYTAHKNGKRSDRYRPTPPQSTAR